MQQELTCFRNIQLVVESCEDPLKWWKARERQFLVIGYLACHILGIVGAKLKQKIRVAMHVVVVFGSFYKFCFLGYVNVFSNLNITKLLSKTII